MHQALRACQPEGFLVSGPGLFAVVIDQSDGVHRAGARGIEDAFVSGAFRINHHAEVLIIEREYPRRHGNALGVTLAKLAINDDFVGHGLA
jgi:hypothetical protein